MSDTPILLQPLEQLLNRQLDGNSDARRVLNELAGETLAIKLDGLGVDIFFHAQRDALQLGTEYTDEPAAIISGSPLSIAMLARADGETTSVRKAGVTIHGDTALAQGFQQLFEYLKPDWEEELARLVGDGIAHRVGNFARDFFGWSRDVATRMTEDFAEYFTEEGKDLPTKTEAETFFDDVDTLRSDVDRAEARLAALEPQRGDETA